MKNRKNQKKLSTNMKRFIRYSLDPGNFWFKSNELEKTLKDFMKYQEENRQSLIQTGYPEYRYKNDFFMTRLALLYPSRFPITLFANKLAFQINIKDYGNYKALWAIDDQDVFKKRTPADYNILRNLTSLKNVHNDFEFDQELVSTLLSKKSTQKNIREYNWLEHLELHKCKYIETNENFVYRSHDGEPSFRAKAFELKSLSLNQILEGIQKDTSITENIYNLIKQRYDHEFIFELCSSDVMNHALKISEKLRPLFIRTSIIDNPATLSPSWFNFLFKDHPESYEQSIFGGLIPLLHFAAQVDIEREIPAITELKRNLTLTDKKYETLKQFRQKLFSNESYEDIEAQIAILFTKLDKQKKLWFKKIIEFQAATKAYETTKIPLEVDVPIDIALQTQEELESIIALQEKSLAENRKIIPLNKNHIKNSLKRMNNIWKIYYRGNEYFLKHKKGFDILALLLKNSNTNIAIEDLVTFNAQGIFAAPDSSDFDFEMHLEQLDREAIEAYENRLLDLQARLSRNNLTEKEKKETHSEIVFLEQELKKMSFSRNSVASQNKERLRSNLTQNLNNAIKDIEKIAPDLAFYLKSRIKTGYTLEFQNDSNEEWFIEY